MNALVTNNPEVRRQPTVFEHGGCVAVNQYWPIGLKLKLLVKVVKMFAAGDCATVKGHLAVVLVRGFECLQFEAAVCHRKEVGLICGEMGKEGRHM